MTSITINSPDSISLGENTKACIVYPNTFPSIPVQDQWTAPYQQPVIPGIFDPFEIPDWLKTNIPQTSANLTLGRQTNWIRTEEKGHVTYAIDLPGVRESDIELSIENGEMRVDYHRVDQNSHKRFDACVLRDVVESTARATFELNVLRVTFKKAEKPTKQIVKIEK